MHFLRPVSAAFLFVWLSLTSISGLADSFVVSLVPNQTFTSLGSAESAMRAHSAQASHLVQYDVVSQGSQTTYYYNVPPVPATVAPRNIYGAPYYIYDAYFWVPPGNSIQEVIGSWWTRYQSYWYWAFPGCTYTHYPSDGAYSNYFGSVILSGTCSGGDGISGSLIASAGSPVCPNDYTLSGAECVIGLTATITATTECPIRPLTIPNPDSHPFDPTLLTQAMQDRLACLQGEIGQIGGSTFGASTYRPPEYQAHFYEVWQANQAISRLPGKFRESCAAVIQQVRAEMDRHRIIHKPARPGRSLHEVFPARAFDLRINLPSQDPFDVTIDIAASTCGLYRFNPIGDPWHFNEP